MFMYCKDGPVCRGAYLEQVWCRVQQPTWLTDIFFPVVLAALAIGVAWIGVRQQIKHAERQRRKVRLEEALARLSHTLRSEIKAFEQEGDDFPFEGAEIEGFLWMEDAFWEVRVLLRDPSALRGLHQICRNLSRVVRTLRHHWRRRTIAIGSSIDDRHARQALMNEASRYTAALENTVQRLFEWDGTGRPPEVGSAWKEFALERTRAELREWDDKLTATFDDAVTEAQKSSNSNPRRPNP
jgi:hypothetical protein